MKIPLQKFIEDHVLDASQAMYLFDFLGADVDTWLKTVPRIVTLCDQLVGPAWCHKSLRPNPTARIIADCVVQKVAAARVPNAGNMSRRKKNLEKKYGSCYRIVLAPTQDVRTNNQGFFAMLLVGYRVNASPLPAAVRNISESDSDAGTSRAPSSTADMIRLAETTIVQQDMKEMREPMAKLQESFSSLQVGKCLDELAKHTKKNRMATRKLKLEAKKAKQAIEMTKRSTEKLTAKVKKMTKDKKVIASFSVRGSCIADLKVFQKSRTVQLWSGRHLFRRVVRWAWR